MGYVFASSVCVACHAIEPGDDTSANEAAPSFQQVADVRGESEAALVFLFQRPHETMPVLILSPSNATSLPTS